MILLTGAPGWLGNRFVEVLGKNVPVGSDGLLAAGNDHLRCLCLSRNAGVPLKALHSGLDIVAGDITARESLKEFFRGGEGSTLFHLAGIVHPDRGVRQFYDVNVGGTGNVLEMAREHGIGKVILLSSNSQSGCNPDSRHYFTEDSPYNPSLNYGRSKMMMEQLAKRFVRDHGMDITVLRTCWFYGPHQPERQTAFFRMIRRGKLPLVGDGTNVRSLSYVDNICQAMLLAAERPVSKGKTYWIADERPYSMNEIVDTVRDVLEKEFHCAVQRGGMRLPSCAGAAASALDAVIQGAGFYQKEIHVLSELNKNIACSVASAGNELGYRPAVALREGMRRSIQWCLDNGIVI